MRTSVGFFAFAGLLAAFAAPLSAQEVSWKKSYWEARDQGQKVKKPLAVIVGTGPTGFQQVLSDGTLSSDVRKILADEYIPVYLDADKAENAKLIQELGILSKKGVVLSCRAGETQAYFHEGSLSEVELTRQLKHFADPNVSIRSTLNGSGRYSYYQPSSSFQPSNFVPASSSRNC